MQMFAENTINSGSSIFEKQNDPKCQKGWAKTWSKVVSKLGPRMLRNIIGPRFDSKNGSFVFFSFWKISFPLQKEDDFLTKKHKMKTWTKLWLQNGNFWTKSCLYSMHIYIYMLWCYYLGQVWPFEVLLSGPSLFFYKTLFVKKHYKDGCFSTFFLKKKIARANLRCYYLGQVGHF